MLQSMRDNMKGAIAFIIVGFLAFILAASLVNLSGDNNASTYDEVATVNDRVITERELSIGISQERQRLQNQFGNNLPAEFVSDDRLRDPVLEGLVANNVLIDKAFSSGMTVSDRELDKLIIESPQFQRDGSFDRDLFVQNVRRFGHTPVSYRNLMRDSIVSNDLRQAIFATGFVTQAELNKAVALSQQKRSFSWINFPLGDLPASMEVSDDEVAAYYEENKGDYLTEEKVSVEYIAFEVNDFSSDLDVPEEDIRNEYESEIAQINQSQQREAAHILIEGDDESAQQKITEVQEKIAAGEDFSELAKTYSDDFGSKENGGVLGFSSGDLFPAAFEETLRTLQPGEVSEPVEIDDVTHIIKLVSIKEADIPTFEESRERIATQIKRIQAEEVYTAKLNELKDIAYNADTLETVASELKLTMATTDLFSRNAPTAEAVLNDRRVVDAAFSDQVLKEGYTSEVLELSPEKAVVLNLLKHEPVRTLTLDEKRQEIVGTLQLSKAETQLSAEISQYIEALKTGKPLEQLAEEAELELITQEDARRDTGSIDRQLREYVFEMKRPKDGDVISSAKLSNGDMALVVLSQVEDADYTALTEQEQRNNRLSLTRLASSTEYQAWQQALVNEADIDYKIKTPLGEQ